MTMKVKLMNGNVYDVDENDMINIEGETYVYNPETSTFQSCDSDKETNDIVDFWENEEE